MSRLVVQAEAAWAGEAPPLETGLREGATGPHGKHVNVTFKQLLLAGRLSQDWN